MMADDLFLDHPPPQSHGMSGFEGCRADERMIFSGYIINNIFISKKQNFFINFL